jgi:predicted alpha-1,2-mannosidase
MRRIFPFSSPLLFTLILFGCPTVEPEPDPEPEPRSLRPVEYVDPLIGSGGLGFGIAAAFPGATTPFGFVRLGPDTSLDGIGLPVMHAAGYWYEDTHIEGFGHLHLHGTGVTDYGNVFFMPTLGMDSSKTEEKGYLQAFGHEDEVVEAGYYAVTLDDTDIRVELSSTLHAGIQRYTFPASDEAVVLLDLAHALGDGYVDVSEVSVDPDHAEITGYIHNVGEFTSRVGGVDIYFVSRFSRTPSSYGTWTGEQITVEPGSGHEEGDDIGAWFAFATEEGEQIEVRTGISVIDLDHARAHLDTEIPLTLDFDDVRQWSEDTWDAELSVIQVEGGTEDQKVIFYTALYHALMMPTTWTEDGGDYTGFDNDVHFADGWTYYTDLSLWDTFRTEHPLLTLIAPERQSDMVRSMERMLAQGGGIPQWALATGDTGSMIGTPADQVIAETYLKGLRGYDVDALYDEMYAHATGPVEHGNRGCIEHYRSLGYCPYDLQDDASSKTLEYANNDYSVALLADALGHGDDADELFAQALSYTEIFNPATGFFQGRDAAGEWLPDFDPEYFTEDWTEASAWQYLWHVQHDPEGLADLLGGREAAVAKLEELMELTVDWHDDYEDSLVPPPYYWHGNEPDMHATYLFSAWGRPDLAQQWMRYVLDFNYGTGPDGMVGNDDCGTLSSWYVFSAMGLYPVAGTTGYWVGAPLFEKMTIHRDAGDVVITADGISSDSIYVQSLTLGGQEVTQPLLDHADLADGGTLAFVMGDAPSSWGQ